MDDYINELLTQERVCDVALPKMRSRLALEEDELLEPWSSPLEKELNGDDESEEETG